MFAARSGGGDAEDEVAMGGICAAFCRSVWTLSEAAFDGGGRRANCSGCRGATSAGCAIAMRRTGSTGCAIGVWSGPRRGERLRANLSGCGSCTES